MLDIVLLFGSVELAFRLCKVLLQFLNLLFRGHIVRGRLGHSILQISLFLLERLLELCLLVDDRRNCGLKTMNFFSSYLLLIFDIFLELCNILLQFLVLTLLALVLSFETGIGFFRIFALVSKVVRNARDFLIEFLNLILEVENRIILFFFSCRHFTDLLLGLRLRHTLQ